MRRFVTVVMLGGVGAALLVKAFSVTTSGPAQISPFFLMMALTPLVIRYVSNRPGRREMFLTCMGVGTLMSVALLGWFAFMKNTAHASLSSYAISSVLLLSCVALASWVIAVIASDRPDTDGRGQRRMLLDILASASLFGVCYSLLGVWRHFSGAAGVFNTVSWAVFLASWLRRSEIRPIRRSESRPLEGRSFYVVCEDDRNTALSPFLMTA